MTLHPDVIVSDICMPLVSGPEAMRKLRDTGLNIPFVLISASSVDAEKHVSVGATAFVDKTDMVNELASAIRAASVGQVYFSQSVGSPVCASFQYRENYGCDWLKTQPTRSSQVFQNELRPRAY